MRRIEIKPVPGTSIAESKDEAADLREKRILPALAKGEVIELDFDAVGIATQSFMHALISEAIRRHGDRAFELLAFKNCSDDVKQIVLTVFEYTLLASETSSRELDDGGESRYRGEISEQPPETVSLHERVPFRMRYLAFA